MKTKILILVALSLGLTIQAMSQIKDSTVVKDTIITGDNPQWTNKNDSTTVRIGKKKIIIIEEKGDSKIVIRKEADTDSLAVLRLNEGMEGFEKEIRILEDSIEMLEKRIRTAEDEAIEEDLQRKKERFEMQIEAFEEGLEEMEEEIEELTSEIEIEFTEEDFGDWMQEEEKGCDKDKFHGHYAGFELGFNNFWGPSFSRTLPTEADFMSLNTNKSLEVSLNFAEVPVVLIPRVAALVSGMGLRWNNYWFENPITLTKDVNGVITDEQLLSGIPSTIAYKKNNLNTTWLTIPLMLELQIPSRKEQPYLFASFGVEAGFKLRSATKKEWEEQKSTKVDDYQINTFQYGLVARVGANAFSLYARASLVPLFEQNKGPEMYPVSVGLSIVPF